MKMWLEVGIELLIEFCFRIEILKRGKLVKDWRLKKAVNGHYAKG